MVNNYNFPFDSRNPLDYLNLPIRSVKTSEIMSPSIEYVEPTYNPIYLKPIFPNLDVNVISNKFGEKFINETNLLNEFPNHNTINNGNYYYLYNTSDLNTLYDIKYPNFDQMKTNFIYSKIPFTNPYQKDEFGFFENNFSLDDDNLIKTTNIYGDNKTQLENQKIKTKGEYIKKFNETYYNLYKKNLDDFNNKKEDNFNKKFNMQKIKKNNQSIYRDLYGDRNFVNKNFKPSI